MKEGDDEDEQKEEEQDAMQEQPRAMANFDDGGQEGALVADMKR